MQIRNRKKIIFIIATYILLINTSISEEFNEIIIKNCPNIVSKENLNCSKIKIKKIFSKKIGNASKTYVELKNSPCTYENIIYTASSNGCITAINIEGIEIWKKKLNIKEISTISCNKKFIFLSTMYGDIISLNRKNGNTVWQVNFQGAILSKPSFDNIAIYVQTINGHIAANDIENGRIIWQFKIKNYPKVLINIHSSPIIYKKSLIILDSTGNIYKIKKNGEKIWKINIKKLKIYKNLVPEMLDIVSNTNIEHDNIYFATFQDKLISLNLKLSKINWYKQISIINEIIKDDNNIFIINKEGIIESYHKNSGMLLWQQTKLKNKEPLSMLCLKDYLVTTDIENNINIFDKKTGKYINNIKINEKIHKSKIVNIENKIFVQTEKDYLIGFNITK